MKFKVALNFRSYLVNSCSLGFMILFLAVSGFSQDGSDMNYLKPEKLTKKDVGKWVHLDFGNRSFMTGYDMNHYKQRRGDSVSVELDGQQVVFVEYRSDDGYNSWFNDQYLETDELFDGLKIRWLKNKLLSIDGDDLKVEAYFQYYTPTGNPIRDKTLAKELTFKKVTIAEVLEKNEH